MRARTILAAPLIAAATLALAACGGGDGDGGNAIDNVAGNGFDNAADPMAVETMYNGGDAGTGLDASGNGTAGSAANTGAPTANGAETAVPPPSRGTNVGGDTGGNAAGGTTNGM